MHHCVNFINLITHYQFLTFTSNSSFFLFISLYIIPSYYPRCLFTVIFFTFNEEIHSYNTRTKDKLHLYHSSTTSVLRSVRVVSEMTYTVSSGTLNSSIPYHTLDQLDIKLLFYGMTCRRRFNKLSHYQCLKII